MSDTIRTFYPRLAIIPEIIELVTTSFPDDAAAVLQGMKAGSRLEGGRDEEEELEDMITGFVLDHAQVITSYKGLGSTPEGSQEAMTYLEKHHPEAHHLLQTQAQGLKNLLGKDGAAIALGQAREPFTINVLTWNGMYVTTAEDFPDVWFIDKGQAISFAQSNYESFIKNSGGERRQAESSDVI